MTNSCHVIVVISFFNLIYVFYLIYVLIINLNLVFNLRLCIYYLCLFISFMHYYF